MNTLPRLASGLLYAFGVDTALIGDLEESARAGRSRLWCWRQVAGILLLAPFRLGLTRPIYTARALAIGWIALLVVFALIDSPVFTRLSLDGYRTGQWMPFWTAAFVLSYAGFAFSAWAVARFHRRVAGMLIVHTATVMIGLGVSALMTELHPEGMRVPHVLFPLVSVALPYQWRSGFILAPAVMLLTGMLVLRKSNHPTVR